MILKERVIDEELAYLLQLSLRTNLSKTEQNTIDTRIKGFIGEQIFDRTIEKNYKHALILNDLRLLTSNIYFQIDSLIIMNQKIFIFEIKNYYCDINYLNGSYYFQNGEEISSLNEQMMRTNKLLPKFLHNNYIYYNYNYYTTFVNPDYNIYGYLPDDQILSFHQISNFIKNNSENKQNAYAQEVAQLFLNLHQSKEHFNFRKNIDITSLKMGVTCHCNLSFYRKLSNRRFICKQCNKVIACEDFLKKCIEDILLIFPQEKLTVNIIYCWTEGNVSKEKIRLYLNKCYAMKKFGPQTHYQ